VKTLRSITSNTRRLSRLAAAVGAVALTLFIAASASACPTCREALADNPQGQSLAKGFYYSILFMMSMPFLVLGTLGTVAYRSIHRAKVEQSGSAPADR
jgi:hypothetical protein